MATSRLEGAQAQTQAVDLQTQTLQTARLNTGLQDRLHSYLARAENKAVESKIGLTLLMVLAKQSAAGWVAVGHVLEKRTKAELQLNARDTLNGWTAFHWACSEGSLEAVQLLLEAGAESKMKSLCAKKETGVMVCIDYATPKNVG